MMAYYAKIIDSLVTDVIVLDEQGETIARDWLADNIGGTWLSAYRDNGPRAEVGSTYDEDLDAFIPPKPSEDATLDTETYTWIVPEVEEAD